MHLPSHPQHDADLADDDVYPWADHARDECDWCGKTSCFCAEDPDGDFEDGFEDDDDFFEAMDEHGVPY